MMANKRASFSSDDGAHSAEDHHHHSTSSAKPSHGYYDSDSDRDVVVAVAQRRDDRLSQGPPRSQPSTVALPESPVSTRGRDSYNQPSSPLSSRGPTSLTTGGGHDDAHSDNEHSNKPVKKHDDDDDNRSRNSWEENDSDEEPYQAYDYGQEDEDDVDEDEFEERPRSHRESHRYSAQSDSLQQPQKLDHNDGDSVDEDEFEERPRSHRHSAQSDSLQQPQKPDHNDDSVDEDEFEERPRSHRYSAQSDSHHQPQKPDHNDDVDEDEFEERPRSRRHSAQSDSHHQPQKLDHNDDSMDEDEFEERPRSHRHSAQSDSLHQPQKPDHNDDAEDNDIYDDYGHDDDKEDSHAQPHGDHDHHDHHGHEDVPQGRPSTDSLSRRSSFEEQDLSQRHHDDEAALEDPAAFYDEMDESAPNPDMFRGAANHRASVASAKSFASHSKHHSFGYDDRPADHGVPSDSESASSEPEREKHSDSSLPSSRPPSVPPKSRPTSTLSRASFSTPASPAQTRFVAPIAAEHWQISEEPAAVNGEVAATEPVAAPVAAPIQAPVVPEPEPVVERAATPLSPLAVDTVSQKSTSSASSIDQRQKRYSGSDSDTSDTSIDLHSPTIKNHLRTAAPIFNRTASNTSREIVTNGANAEKQRPISYATVFSDAEMNDVNLMDEPLNDKRASEVVPLTPSTASAFGFPSSLFGGRNSQLAPQRQQQPPVQPTPIPAPAPVDTRARSTSISALASSIQGAFSRGFSLQNQPPLPPVPRTPSQISQRASTNTGPIPNMGVDRRFSTNRSNGSDRASTISNMTNDSNMDLLLARLEAQNELLVMDSSKRRTTTESEMDRAIVHAKEENAGEDVDWDYWGALMHDYNGVVKRNPKQLPIMIQKGVPSALRGLIWQLLAKSKDVQLDATYTELLKSPSTHEKQITRDLSRTFPHHEYFQADGVGQEALFNVVKAYSLYDPEVGYCQGLSFVVGPLLLNMPEEESFCMLVRMMNSYEMRGHYTPDMSMLTLRLFQFEQLMEETVPLVFKHLRNQGIRSTMYASQWFMTLFAYKFPLDLVYRVYDIILVEGIDSILRFAIALLKANHDKILSLDFEVLIEFLKNGLFECYVDQSGLFIQDAYNVKVTPRKLAQYAQKHQAIVQKQQADLAEEESLKESNRQLSSNVRRLESSLDELNKEHVDLAKELITRKMEMAQMQDQNDVLTQKVSDLSRIAESQAKEVEEQYKGEIEDVLRKNMAYLKKNEQLEDQLSYMESLLVETKMKYAESEIERDVLNRKLSDMRKALGAM
ncbi:rab-GTPase-TBC domain-containing protein [Dissophora ornata]|nr:rab-GTPase-TBC domain-containing protein [Dissophora ornata]